MIIEFQRRFGVLTGRSVSHASKRKIPGGFDLPAPASVVAGEHTSVEPGKGTSMNVLSGKVAIVTGASSGIGRATAQLFAHEGAKLVVGARRHQELDELVAEIAAAGGAAIAHAGDIRDEACAQALVELATREFGSCTLPSTMPALLVRWDRSPKCRWVDGVTRSIPT